MQILLLIIGAVLGESVYDAAKIARDLVHGVGVVGELATIMQSNSHGVAGVPYTSLQMVWDCDNEPGYPMVGLVSWGTHAKNVQTNANASIQIRHPSLYPTVDNPANRPGFLNNPRFTIFGQLQKQEKTSAHMACLLSKHPNAREWFNSHDFQFYKLLVIGSLNFIGGYGTDHYVGWIPSHLYLPSNLPSNHASCVFCRPW